MIAIRHYMIQTNLMIVFQHYYTDIRNGHNYLRFLLDCNIPYNDMNDSEALSQKVLSAFFVCQNRFWHPNDTFNTKNQFGG